MGLFKAYEYDTLKDFHISRQISMLQLTSPENLAFVSQCIYEQQSKEFG
jgi:hypothetical protein